MTSSKLRQSRGAVYSIIQYLVENTLITKLITEFLNFYLRHSRKYGESRLEELGAPFDSKLNFKIKVDTEK